MSDEITREYFGSNVKAWRSKESGHPYPWSFEVDDGRAAHQFLGIPNHCPSRASALRRGWWRAKWLNDGTFYSRYA